MQPTSLIQDMQARGLIAQVTDAAAIEHMPAPCTGPLS